MHLVLQLHPYKTWPGQWLQTGPIHSTPFFKCGWGILSLILGPFVEGRRRNGVKRANRSFKLLQWPPTGPPTPRQLCLCTQPWWSPLNSCKSNVTAQSTVQSWPVWPITVTHGGSCCAPQPTQYIYAFNKFIEHHLIPSHQVAKRRSRPIPALKNSWSNRATITFQWRS